MQFQIDAVLPHSNTQSLPWPDSRTACPAVGGRTTTRTEICDGWGSNPQPTPKAVPPKTFGVRGCSTIEPPVSRDCSKDRWPPGDSFSPSVCARAYALTRCWAFRYWQRAQEVAQNGALSGLHRAGALKAYVRCSPLNRCNDGHTTPGGCRPKPFLGELGWVGLEPTTNALKGRRFRFTTSWLLSSYDHANFGCSICCSAGLSLLFLFQAVAYEATHCRSTAGCTYRNALSGWVFVFAKLAPSDKNKGVVRGLFIPKGSQLASHPSECAVGASASDGRRRG